MACDGDIGKFGSVFRSVSARVRALPPGLGTCVALAAVLAALGTIASSSARRRPRTASPAAPVTRPKRTRESPLLVGRGASISFRPKACLEFAPTGRWNGLTAFLDPGHGGVDSGATPIVGDRLVAEKKVTLALAQRMLGLLRAAGYRVVMSRIDDSTVARFGPADLHQGLLTPTAAEREIEARNLCANAAHADVLLALHMNSFVDPSATGAETVYCPSRPFAARSRRLAHLVQRAMVSAMRRSGRASVDRGVLPDREAGGAPLTVQTENYHHLIQLGPADPP